MKTLTPNQFQKLIAVIHCANGEDFKSIFGGDYEHYWSKFINKTNTEFICYLDSGNIKLVFDYFYNKMIEQNEKYGGPAV